MTTNITALVQRLKVAAKNGCCHTIFQDDCLALVEALDEEQAENAAGVAGMAESYETIISMLRSRIAELESRTVKLPLPRRKTADDYVDDTFEPCDLAAVYNACRLECEVKFKNALTAAGIKVEAE